MHSLEHARHAAPDPLATIRTPSFWLQPIIVVLVVFSALAALYLGGILNPTSNLHHFPVAVVNPDAGPDGKQIADGLVSGLDSRRFDVRVLSAEEADRPAGLRARSTASCRSRPTSRPAAGTRARRPPRPGDVAARSITVSTNPRAGELGGSIAGLALGKAVNEINTKIGQQLTAQVTQAGGGTACPAAWRWPWPAPIDIQVNDHDPLPNGTGNGLSAFYYALLLLLAGFTGSIVVSSLVDSMLGYVPAEMGPVYRFAEQVNISRFRTLLIKWGFMVVLALLTSAAYIGIAAALGMPIPQRADAVALRRVHHRGGRASPRPR